MNKDQREKTFRLDASIKLFSTFDQLNFICVEFSKKLTKISRRILERVSFFSTY